MYVVLEKDGEQHLGRMYEKRRTTKRRKVNWFGHILRRNCLLMHVIEGKLEERIEVTGRRGRRRKHLVGDVKEKRRGWK